MTPITCIEDLRQLFRKRVPRMFFEYTEAGSWTESTLKDNLSAFEAIKLRQKILVDMTDRSLKTRMAGQEVAMPVALAPVGLTGMLHADGEIKAARAAERFGIPYCLSTMSICSIEDVAEHTSEPFWFQLYVMRDREFIGRLINRAKAAGCSALVLTVDLQILGQRHVDVKNGLSTPPKPTLKNLLNIAGKPRWAFGMARTRRKSFGNIVGHHPQARDTRSLSIWTARQFDPKLNWDDVQWIRDRWGGTLILKGIIDVEDARMAARSGADAIIVSNHGGRQLDGAPAAADALPPIAAAVGNDVEVWVDGGIRTGQDLFRALALGAKGTMVGRAYAYGLGALGEEGVVTALEILRRELDLTMAFCGLRNIEDVSEDVIWRA
ncbi:MAG: alpha-hydroxy acid oxidase [Gammaproteobacteria bacterium]|nr:alpha-hydroxy acid oxidase [Gammaproteobacteria bacterium]MDE0368412.1 alpha-hydroxy acid oxidase [Gammaproteobacteria bacterium]